MAIACGSILHAKQVGSTVEECLVVAFWDGGDGVADAGGDGLGWGWCDDMRMLV